MNTKFIIVAALLAVGGCANQLQQAGQKTVTEIVKVHDDTAELLVRAPCAIPLGSIVRKYGPSQRAMVMSWGDEFCRQPATAAPGSLPGLSPQSIAAAAGL